MKKKEFKDFEFALRLPNNLSAYIRSVGNGKKRNVGKTMVL